MKYLSWPTFDIFWRKHPALFTGFHILLATAFAINFHAIFFFPLLLLWISCRRIWWLISHVIILVLSFAYIKTNFINYNLPPDGFQGEAVFALDSLAKSPSNFGYSLVYKGTIKTFETTSGEILKNLPCKIALPCKSLNEHLESRYLINGTLKQKSPFSFVLKPDKSEKWDPLDSEKNLVHLRYVSKNMLKNYLKKVIPNEHAYNFLVTLITGDATEQMLFFNFGQLGLSHILAISGFHFAIISLFFYAILKRIFPFKLSNLITFGCVTLYFLFLGSSPSIQRAWLMISYILIGQSLERQGNGLNAIGIALMVNLLIRPYDILNIGFQLSFACTLAILLIYPTFENLLKKTLPNKLNHNILKLSALDLHGYILLTLIRKSFAISLATNLLSLPIILFHFHRFPIAGIAYNLFFPWLVSLIITFFLISCLIPVFGVYLHHLNSHFTSFVLLITENPPIRFLFFLRGEITETPVTILLSLTIFISIFIMEDRSKNFTQTINH